MKNNLVGLVVGITISIIICGSVLVPAINDATTTHKTFENEGLYYMTDTSEAITYEYLGSSQWEVNGETLDYTTSGATNIIVANDIYVRNNGQVRGTTYQGWDTATVTVENGTVTGTATSGENTLTINWDCSDVFYGAVNEKSDYIMTDGSSDVYVLGTDSLCGIGLTQVGNVFVTFKVSVENGVATADYISGSTVTITNVQLNWEEVEGYENLYNFESISFTATVGEVTANVTYNKVIAPSSTTAELSEHMTGEQIILVSIIPVIVILALVVTAAYAITRRD